jgi:hypothetical protein
LVVSQETAPTDSAPTASAGCPRLPEGTRYSTEPALWMLRMKLAGRAPGLARIPTRYWVPGLSRAEMVSIGWRRVVFRLAERASSFIFASKRKRS